MKTYKVFLVACLALGVLSVSAAGLKGTPASQIRQNEEADESNLTRIEDDAMLERFKKRKQLVPLPELPGVRIDPRLDEKCRYVRPWTAKFIRDTATAFRKQFPGREFQINSAVRTKESQKLLRLTNGNAASTEGKRQTSHTTGATIDVAKLPLTKKEIEWFRKWLLGFEKKGLIEVTEERRQAVFHFMVFRKYEGYVMKPDRT